ncbi:MAG: hypothetical protein ABI221_00505, partial [Candidatus Saccharimonadales bacterium]
MDPTNVHNANLNLPPLQLPEVKPPASQEQAIDPAAPAPNYSEQAGQPGGEQAMSEQRNMEMAGSSSQPMAASTPGPAGLNTALPVGSGFDPAQV